MDCKENGDLFAKKNAYIQNTHPALNIKTDMLQVIHDIFGTVGSIFVALIAFALLIFWVAALSGIQEYPYSEKRKMVIVTLFILFPPYAFFWLAKDMIRQYRILKIDKD